MTKNWKIITESSVLYSLATALLLASVFSLLNISGTLSIDIVLGAISGALSGILISVVVGVLDQAFTRKRVNARVTSNLIIGFLAGALITSGILFSMVQLVGLVSTIQLQSIFDLPLCCSVGMPLGVIIGSLIGASWRSEEVDSRFS